MVSFFFLFPLWPCQTEFVSLSLLQELSVLHAAIGTFIFYLVRDYPRVYPSIYVSTYLVLCIDQSMYLSICLSSNL